ncbi:Coiled-coil domain-containing protein 96 [Rhizoclosmatium sp. JEL0117]|nr:Coiled-coil domain-containing protein 96 [Rhizoclosmatium sp. JEL0117]
MEGEAPTTPGGLEASASASKSQGNLLKSKAGTAKTSRANLIAPGSQTNLLRTGSQKSVRSKAPSKHGSQNNLSTPNSGGNGEVAAGDGAVEPKPEGVPTENKESGESTIKDENLTEQQKDQQTDERLSHSLVQMSSQLSLNENENNEEQEDAIVGEEIQVIPQVARTLTSPLMTATEVAADGGFTFVNAEYDGFDLDGITHVEDVVSVIPLALKTYMRSGSYEAMMLENVVIDTSLPVKVIIRTPMMRPTSPTMNEDEEKRKREAEEGGANADASKNLDEAAAIAIVEEGIDREALIASIKNELDLKEKYKIKNSFLQNKLGEYFKRKRTDDAHDGEKSVADQEQRYSNCMTALTTLRTEYESLNSSNQKIVNEYKVKLEEHTAEAFEKSEEFIKFKRTIALSAENSRTGKCIPPKTFAQLEATDQRKEMEVVAVRLDHIKLRNKLKRHEQLLRQKEELADGLHLIDFEQLKIENQTYNEKIEERNEELLKLRKKITNIVQVLTHVKEKLQFVQAENGSLRKELKGLDNDVAIRRDSLPASKQSRDAIKNLNTSLRQKNGLLGNKPLLRDYEDKVDETDGLKARIDELRTTHANLSAETLSIKRQIQRKLITPPIMVSTRSSNKRAASATSTKEATSPVKAKKTKTSPLPFKKSDLEKKKKSLNKVTPPKPAPNTNRVPHPKKLADAKSKLKVVTTNIKTGVVVKASSPASPQKAASSPSKSPVRLVSPVKRPRSAEK